jgi:hypothetical protein
VLQLKSAWRDGTTHIKMSPLEFMQRLAALVPRPRLHLIRFRRPDPQGKNGSATGQTIPRGPCSRVAVKLRRCEAIRADVALKQSSRVGNFHQTPCD